LQQYEPTFLACYHRLMAAKIGLLEYCPSDKTLIDQLLALMAKDQVDYTLFFRKLCDFSTTDHSIRDYFIDRDQFDRWAEHYLQRLSQQAATEAQRQKTMRSINPQYVLRNYMAQTAIEAAENGDYSEIELLLKVLQNPFVEQSEASKYAGLPPDWAAQISVSCSS